MKKKPLNNSTTKEVKGFKGLRGVLENDLVVNASKGAQVYKKQKMNLFLPRPKIRKNSYPGLKTQNFTLTPPNN